MAVTRDSKSQARLPPALDPERLAIVQPYRELVARGLISSIKVEFTGGTTSVSVNLGSQVSVPDGQTRDNLTPGMAKQYIIDANLWSPKGNDKKTSKNKDASQLPQNSLCKKDFEAGVGDDQLKKRASEVATKLGSSTARGRIGSLNMMVRGVDTFNKWWAGAPPSAKTRLVMDGKHHAQLTKEDHQKFASVVLQCPFRGDESVPTPTEEETQTNGAGPTVPIRGVEGKPKTPSPKK